MGHTADAIQSFEEANRLAPRIPTTLLALAIAQQTQGSYPAAVDALKEALAIDPLYVPAINSLAMTQKLMGQPEKADHNYEHALKTLAQKLVANWRNQVDSPRFPLARSRNQLWVTYANSALLWLAACDSTIDAVALPNGEMAEEDAATHNLKGWYWNDFSDSDGRRTRLFYPNFFNAFHFSLVQSRIYSELIGNRSTVLRILGRNDEAEACLQEAMDFSPMQDLPAA